MARFEVSGSSPFPEPELAALVRAAARKLRENGIHTEAVYFQFAGKSCSVTVRSRHMSVTLGLQVGAISTALRMLRANEHADWN